ncbi:elks delta-like protein [Trypanosoma rangeli]|uniref:Elks delta-like protein n=1 Tax=Trypanosoma rangeli TaxID=5698 RepID=A0A422NVX8_TRYRA|nr:elks delta-like protein [Trypanosoma rangeli]RNF09610.1 elks delta-like protein [Trypanosoma rangeli]|eukprot:RNF09610.1 elks delta-like protein [Trypanosoma rangeli]
MDEKQEEAVRVLKQQLQEIEDTLLAQEKLLQDRNQKMALVSVSVVDAEKALEESEEELREAQMQLENVVADNRIAHTELARLQTTSGDRLPRDEYVRELSEADSGLKEMEGQVQELVTQVESLSGGSASDVDARRQLTLVRLISMLDDLHTSLSRSLQRVPLEEDARAREVLKAIRELSRERERAIGYCLRKKREVADIIELKKQRANELTLDSRRKLSTLGEDHEKATLGVVEKIQAERKALREEVESVKSANQQLWDALRDTKYSSDFLQGGDSKREAAVSASDTLRRSADVEEEKNHLREQLKLFEVKRTKLQRMIEELRTNVNAEMEKHALKLRDLKHEIELQQRESHKLEGENRKLKSLCDSLAVTLEA